MIESLHSLKGMVMSAVFSGREKTPLLSLENFLNVAKASISWARRSPADRSILKAWFLEGLKTELLYSRFR